jgi:hypothetical protein
MSRILLMTLALVVAGCVQLPPTPQDVHSKRFESLPDRAVIYVVRTPMDSWEASGLSLGDSALITTNPGTYYRWEVTPGTHHIGGYASTNESIVLNTVPGRIYFLEHTVRGTRRSGVQSTSIRQIDEREGRALVSRSQLL